ncbi:MAG TPA: hypothetical protein VM261_16960 [Kofleriaceae bacterium]|nr:hypothetical protein [Kofleriaceae bacterium]
MKFAVLIVLVVTGCASANMTSDDDGTDAADESDAVESSDAPEVDAVATDAAASDGAMIDGAAVDATVDARVDAGVDATPIDAMCTPTWHDVLGNGGFDSGVTPWTQTSTSIRDVGGLPFNPHSGTHAAMMGIGNNANDVMVQTVTIPAGATGLRVRGYQCFVTEDPIEDTDTFRATIETPGGAVLETLLSVTNSDTAPICIWTPFTWTATSGHAGATVVLRMRGTTNIAFLTRFVVDSMTLEWLGC